MKYLFLLLLMYSPANAGMRVGVVDTGLDVQDQRVSSHICGYKDFTGTGIIDRNGHGTHVVGTIIKYAKDAPYCLVIAKYTDVGMQEGTHMNTSIEAMRWLANQDVDIINYSSSGEGDNDEERDVIESHAYIDFVVAAGNENRNIDSVPIFPASYKLPNVYPIGCWHMDNLCAHSDWGARVGWEDGYEVESFALGAGTVKMSGSSMATAIRTGKLIYKHFTFLNN